MKYATFIKTSPEGIGSILQYILSCYLLCKKFNIKYVHTRVENIEHMIWDNYDSQEKWDNFWNNYIVNIFLPRSEVILKEELTEDINYVKNSFDFNKYDETLFIFYEASILCKGFLDRELNNSLDVFTNLSDNYFENSKLVSYYKNDVINIAIHVRKYTKTDSCLGSFRELYTPNSKIDIYCYNIIFNISKILENKKLNFHIYTQLDKDEQMFDHYMCLKNENVDIIIHTGHNTPLNIHHMIISDIFVMSKSSLSLIVNYYRKGLSVLRNKIHHSVRNDLTILSNDSGEILNIERIII